MSLLSASGALLLKGGDVGDVSSASGDYCHADDQLLHVGQLVDADHCLGGWNAINPSFSWGASAPGTIAVAFRGLCLQRAGEHVAWYSKMVVGTTSAADFRSGCRIYFNWTSLELAPDLRQLDEEHRCECSVPGLDIAKGPEDPRFVRTQAGLFAVITGYDVMKRTSKDPGGCPVCGEHAVMLHAAPVKSLSPPEFGDPVPLTFEGMGRVEKNWAMFGHSSHTGATVLAAYSVFPHTIASVDLLTGDVKFLAETKSDAVRKLAESLGTTPESFHGGAGVAHVHKRNASYFMSVLHAAVHSGPEGRKEYWNFPYTFSDEHPYEVLHVGKPLPLQKSSNPAYGELVAFVTTLMIDDGDMFLGYGSGDRSSRTLRMPFDEFETTFFPSSFMTGTTDTAEKLGSGDLAKLRSARGRAASACARRLEGCDDDLTPSVCRTCHGGAA